jgi:transcriptional regulator with XRE-family HTH domain
MPASKKQHYTRYTLAAVDLLGSLIQIERTAKRMMAQDFADRLGIDRGTLKRLEDGDPKVELGVAFEACALLGIKLFDEDLRGITVRAEEAGARAALLPRKIRTRQQLSVDNDF